MEFVDNWYITATLGEGAFGEVKLLHHRTSAEAVALKVLRFNEGPESRSEQEAMVRKEVSIHRQLKHENIVQFYGARMDDQIWYIFLEYATGGELYDRIEPDVGLTPKEKAHPYFTQIINGLTYMHSLGIAHRDLKPENILLKNDTIKITDFGLATLYKNADGVERLLESKCGTAPYVSPEVLAKPNYKAMPVDVWAAGIVLVALLAGELPWDRADPTVSREYKKWKESATNVNSPPWNKFDLQTLNFFKRLLCPLPSKRINLDQIHHHPWITKNKPNMSSSAAAGQLQLKKVPSLAINPLESSTSLINRLCSMSQPDPLHGEEDENRILEDNGVCPPLCFSQPALPAEQFFLPNANDTTSSPTSLVSGRELVTRLVRRMTRFLVSSSVKDTLEEITKTLDSFGYCWKLLKEVHHSKAINVITVHTTDRRKTSLAFKCTVIEVTNTPSNDPRVLLDFRLSRGDGIEFKRHFLRLKESLKHLQLENGPPLEWLIQ